MSTVVVGAHGQLGTALRQVLKEDAVFLSRDDVELTDLTAVTDTLLALRPTAVINAAAYTAVDLAEDEPDLAMRINCDAVGAMAEVSASCGARFVTLSTDYVFDGSLDRPYVESDQTKPINQYGRSKEAGERAAMAANPESLVVRTSWVISGTHPNFVATMLKLAQRGELSVVNDQVGHPTLASDLAVGVDAAAAAGASGILHLTNQGVTTWFDLAREVFELGGFDSDIIRPCGSDEYPTPAARPKNSILESERFSDLGLAPLPHYRDGLPALVQQIESSASSSD